MNFHGIHKTMDKYCNMFRLILYDPQTLGFLLDGIFARIMIHILYIYIYTYTLLIL